MLAHIIHAACWGILRSGFSIYEDAAKKVDPKKIVIHALFLGTLAASISFLGGLIGRSLQSIVAKKLSTSTPALALILQFFVSVFGLGLIEIFFLNKQAVKREQEMLKELNFLRQ
jgi:RsiW-degrading membrane proteinase PrsW (M82 family)